jgi:two-component system NtrC family sensor kinase
MSVPSDLPEPTDLPGRGPSPEGATPALPRQPDAGWAFGEAGFRALVQHSSDIITVHDRTGMLVYASSPGRQITGYPSGAMEGSHVWTFVHPDDLEAVKWAFEDVAERGLSGTQVEYRFRAASGAWRHFESVGNNLLHHPEIAGIVVTTRDVTARREAEHEQARLSIAIEQAGDVVMLLDARWQIEYVNPAFERVSGYPAQAALGNTPRFLDAGLHDEAFVLGIWETLAELGTWTGRVTIRRQDGSLAVQDVSVSPIRSAAGAVTSYVVVARDLSRQLALEEQLRQAQKMELVGQLAGGIAHDFNNLLSPILGYAELVQGGLEEEDPRHRQVGLICEAAERAGILSRQLLGFSRKQFADVRPFDVNAVVKAFVRILRRTIRESIDLQLRLAAPEAFVRGDAAQIEQVLMNLVVNAQDAIGTSGTIVIETDVVGLDTIDPRAQQELRPGLHVMLRVTDTGSGMPPDVQRRIFEPFFTTKETGRGTGLGLANVRGIVAEHKGAITVESQVGAGTSFRVYLPRVEPVKEARPAAALAAAARGTERILVVEDEWLVRDLTCSILRQHGYDVEEHPSAESCLAAADAEDAREAALLVSDVVMPGINGRQLYERLRERWPSLAALYISGYTDEVLSGSAESVSGLDFLQKPFSVQALARTVREILDRNA